MCAVARRHDREGQRGRLDLPGAWSAVLRRPPGEAFATFFDAAADVLEETDFVDICPIGTVAREVASTDDVLRAACDRVFVSWIEAAAARLRLAGVDETESTTLAATVVAALEGALMLARTSHDAGVVRETGRHVRQLVDAVVADGASRSILSRTPAAGSRTRRRQE